MLISTRIWRALIWVTMLVVIVEGSRDAPPLQIRRNLPHDKRGLSVSGASGTSQLVFGTSAALCSRSFSHPMPTGPATSITRSGTTKPPTPPTGSPRSGISGKLSGTSRPLFGTSALACKSKSGSKRPTPTTGIPRSATSRPLSGTSALVCKSRSGSKRPTPTTGIPRSATSRPLFGTSRSGFGSSAKLCSRSLTRPMSAVTTTASRVTTTRKSSTVSSTSSTSSASSTSTASITSSTSSTSTTSTTSSSSTTNSADAMLNFDYSKFCQEDGLTNETWHLTECGDWGVIELGNTISATNKKTWINYLADKLSVDYSCTIDDDAYCQTKSRPDCSYYANAKTFAVLKASLNIIQGGNYLLHAISQAQENFNGMQEGFPQRFISQAIDMTAEIFEQIASALVGAVASMVAPFLASVVGRASANVLKTISQDLSLESYLNGALTSVSQVVERDLKSESTVEDAMYKAFNLTRTTVESYLDGLLNTVPENHNSYNPYGERSGGFPQLVYNGSWAAPITSEKVQKMDLTLSSSILLLVITIYANMEGVYMIETEDMKAYAGDTCGAKLKDDLVRVCVGDKAYFWLKEGYTYWRNGNSKITGFDDDTLSDYQLSLEKLAKAYMYSKEQNGGDNWTVKSAISAYSSGGTAPPDYMFASMKVCKMTTKQVKKIQKKKRAADKMRRLNPGGTAPNTCNSDGCEFKGLAYAICADQLNVKFPT